MDFDGGAIADVFGLMLIGIAPGDIAGLARIVYGPSVGELHGGVEIGEIHDHIRKMPVHRTFQVRLEGGAQDADALILDGNEMMFGIGLNGIGGGLRGGLRLGGVGLQFDHDGFERLIGKILFGMPGGFPVGDLTGLELGVLGPAIRAGEALVQVGQKDGDRCGMVVHGGAFVGTVADTENTDPGIIDFDFVSGGAELNRVLRGEREGREQEAGNRRAVWSHAEVIAQL